MSALPDELLALIAEFAVVIVGFTALVTRLGNSSEQMRKFFLSAHRSRTYSHDAPWPRA